MCGSATWSTKAMPTAASKALPPRSSTDIPVEEASQWVLAAMPNVPTSSGRVVNMTRALHNDHHRWSGADCCVFICTKRSGNRACLPSSAMNVELVRWPSQRERRERMRAAGCPRLLLVENETPAPVITDPMEDWGRVPGDRSDLQARVQGLLPRAERADWGVPRLDEWGVLRFGGRQVTLPPLEARLARVLVEQFRG